jgi:hypothetical protein
VLPVAGTAAVVTVDAAIEELRRGGVETTSLPIPS